MESCVRGSVHATRRRCALVHVSDRTVDMVVPMCYRVDAERTSQTVGGLFDDRAVVHVLDVQCDVRCYIALQSSDVSRAIPEPLHRYAARMLLSEDTRIMIDA